MMVSVKMLFQDSNIDVKEEIIDKYLNIIDSDILNNPQFESQLLDCISFLMKKKNTINIIQPLELYISNDKKGFIIKSIMKPDPECTNENLIDNNSYYQVKFSVSEDGIMQIIRSSGTFYDLDKFRNECSDTDLGDRLSKVDYTKNPILISTYHSCSAILSNGIEVSNSSYSDRCPVECNMNDYEQLIYQTMLHSPKEWHFNMLPVSSKNEFYPAKTSMFRFTDRLSIAFGQSSYGCDGVINSNIYLVDSKNPEQLSNISTPFKKFIDGKYVLSDYAKSIYKDLTNEEIDRKIDVDFLKILDNSDTKTNNIKIYKNIRLMVCDQLGKKYNFIIKK